MPTQTKKPRKAAKKTVARKTPAKPVARTSVSARLADLEARFVVMQGQLETLTYLHAELSYGVRVAAATQIVQRLQPEITKALLSRLMSGNGAG